MSAKPKFLHSANTYWFRGKELPPPKPGTYDAAKWTPPTHQIFSVEIQDDGIWTVKLGGAVIGSGDYGVRTKAFAKSILETKFARFFEPTGFEGSDLL